MVYERYKSSDVTNEGNSSEVCHFPVRGEERMTRINSVRSHDGPILKYLFIDWRNTKII